MPQQGFFCLGVEKTPSLQVFAIMSTPKIINRKYAQSLCVYLPSKSNKYIITSYNPSILVVFLSNPKIHAQKWIPTKIPEKYRKVLKSIFLFGGLSIIYLENYGKWWQTNIYIYYSYYRKLWKNGGKTHGNFCEKNCHPHIFLSSTAPLVTIRFPNSFQGSRWPVPMSLWFRVGLAPKAQKPT